MCKINNFINSSLGSNTVLAIIEFLLIISQSFTQCESKHLFRNQADTQRVLLISLDGFRHDYIETYNLENFSKFVSEGTKASYNNPQFPAQSFPNHWSIVTGSYVDSHGIIANNFYDPVYKEYFNKNKRDLKWWNATEPIWAQTSRQGLKTGVFHWPGSDVPFTNSTYYTSTTTNHDNLSFNSKINQSIKLFIEEDFKFISIYHNQPDSISHKYGINSPEFNVTLDQLDESIGYLLKQLKLNHLYENNFNVIIVSDHGMTNIRRNLIINEYIQADVDASIWSFSKNLIHLKPLIDLDILVAKLNKIPPGLVRLTLKENMPENLNFRNNRRIADVILMAVEGIGFIYVTKDTFQMNHNGQMTSIDLTYEQKKQLLLASADRANHGFDKIYPSMRGIFLASGTRFKKNYSSDQHIENIDVYPLLCEILAVDCPTRNGSIHRVRRFLKNENLFRVNRIFNQKQVMNYQSDYSNANTLIPRVFLVSFFNFLILNLI